MSEQFCHHCGESLVHVDKICEVGGLRPDSLDYQLIEMAIERDGAEYDAELERAKVEELQAKLAEVMTERDGLLGTIRRMSDQQSGLVKQIASVTAERDALKAERDHLKEIKKVAVMNFVEADRERERLEAKLARYQAALLSTSDNLDAINAAERRASNRPVTAQEKLVTILADRRRVAEWEGA